MSDQQAATGGTGDPPLPELLTPAEAAALFRVTTKTMARWANAGVIAVVTLPGGHRRYPAADALRRLNEMHHPSRVAERT